MKGEKMAKRSSFGSIVRKTLSDITNSQPQPKIDDQEECLIPISPLAKECINKLVKEKATLVRLVEDRNKLIELSGVEIQKLKTYLQKMQMQNWNLAQSNSHMLAELNVGKEKIKALQHELACKNAVLKSKNLTMEIACKDAVLESKHLATEIACKDAVLKSKNLIMETIEADFIAGFRPVAVGNLIYKVIIKILAESHGFVIGGETKGPSYPLLSDIPEFML